MINGTTYSPYDFKKILSYSIPNVRKILFTYLTILKSKKQDLFVLSLRSKVYLQEVYNNIKCTRDIKLLQAFYMM